MAKLRCILVGGFKEPEPAKVSLPALLKAAPTPVHARCSCGGQIAPTAVLKAAPGSSVRDYVEPRVKGLKTSLAKVLQTWAKKWAKQIAKRLPKPDKVDLSILIKASTKSIDEILKEIDAEGFSTALMDELSDEMKQAFADGGLEARKMVGLDNSKAMVEQMDQDALDFARERAAELVGMKWVDGELVDNPDSEWSITETTREGVRNLVGDAVEEGWSAGELQDRMLDSYDFSEARAETIARTELANAHVQGNLAGWKGSGVVKGKRSILADTHPDVDVCDECADEGVIPLEDDFEASGTSGPPYHPNCLCAVVPVMDDEMEDES